jgi:tripartite-type tricarboxylate transporter receptor subunit TctC
MLTAAIGRNALVMGRTALALTLLAGAGAAHSQAYPNRTIRMIVPAAAGGTVDLLARAVSQKMGEAMGQPIVVENRAGATTSIAEEYVVKQPPDGYTLLMSGITLATQPYMRANLPYDPQKDFTMISIVANSGNVIVVNPNVPVKTVRELIDLAKSSPKPLNYGTPAFGATGHLAAEMFNQMAGVKLQQVPYKGAAMALQDLMAGQIEMTFDNIPAAISHIRSGKIRAVAVTGSKRDKQLPDVPTIAESGLPGYDIVAWFAMVAPAKLPQDVLNTVHGSLMRTLKDATVLERFERLGFEPVGSTPAELAAYVRSQSETLGRVIRAAGMKPQ